MIKPSLGKNHGDSKSVAIICYNTTAKQLEKVVIDRRHQKYKKPANPQVYWR